MKQREKNYLAKLRLTRIKNIHSHRHRFTSTTKTTTTTITGDRERETHKDRDRDIHNMEMNGKKETGQNEVIVNKRDSRVD